MLRGGAAGAPTGARAKAHDYGSRVTDARAVRWDDEAFARARELAGAGFLEVPGAHLTADQIAVLLHLAREESHGAGRLARLDLTGATIDGRADFDGIRFEGPADFEGVRFTGEATFEEAEFAAWADFELAQFAQGASFAGATFHRSASFESARFEAGADFAGVQAPELRFDGAHLRSVTFRDAVVQQLTGEEAHVAGFLRLDGAQCDLLDLPRVVVDGEADATGATFGEAILDDGRFGADALFCGATFERTARLGGAEIAGSMDFTRARFGGEAEFDEVRVDVTANFTQARIEQARRLGPLCARSLRLDRATFERPVRIEAVAPAASCVDTLFRGGVDLLTGAANLIAAGADFGGPSLIAPLRSSVLAARGRPRLLSLRSAKVAQLTASGVDLRVCRFANAHGLDRMVLERAQLSQPPPGLRWTRRHTIAEEHHWRHAHGARGWYGEDVRGDDGMDDLADPLDAAQVARIYRALRKGREDGRDEPGAADFYYGEMEMRRLRGREAPRGDWLRRRSVRRIEPFVLWAYWLVAGYGLRASRALVALVALIALLALPLDRVGFEGGRGYGASVLYAVESSVSLMRMPDAPLTPAGQVLTLVLRILGPLLFGLGALALRSRVKR